MGIARRVVIGDDDNIRAGELRTMCGLPFRLLVGLARALAVAGRRNVKRPRAIDILLAFDHQDRAPERDRFVDLVFAVQHIRVSAARAPFPAVALSVTDAEARLVALRIADLLESGIVVGRDKMLVALAVALAAAFLWSAIAAVMAVPGRAFVVDLDAHAFGFLMRPRSRVRALRTDRGVITEIVALEIDAVRGEQFLRGSHDR